MPETRKASSKSSDEDLIASIRITISEELSKIREELKVFKEELRAEMSSAIDVMKDELLNVNRVVKEQEQVIIDLKNEVNDLQKDIEGRLLRMTNVIVRGLPEGSGTVKERAQKDEKAVEDLLAEIEVWSGDVTGIKRLGKVKDGHPRLLCVTFRDVSRKHEVLRKAKLLRDSSQFKRVYVQPDLTRMQQAIDWKLRKELKDRRDKGEDVVLFGGVVRQRHELHKNFQM